MPKDMKEEDKKRIARQVIERLYPVIHGDHMNDYDNLLSALKEAVCALEMGKYFLD